MKKQVNKSKVIQVRLTEDDYNCLQEAAYRMGTDASKLVRQLIQMSINAVREAKKQQKIAEERAKDPQTVENEVKAFLEKESNIDVI